MLPFTTAVIVVLLAFVTVHTISYAVWNWRNNNRFGSAVVFAIVIIMLALPLFVLFQGLD